MTFGYKELTDEEKSAFWDVLVSAIADIPDLAEEFVGLGGKANALLGVGIAAIQLFKSKLEYKKYYQNFESIGRGLIPREISTDDTKQIFQTVIDYLKHSRKNEKKLSYYYLNKTKSSELVDDLFNACHNSDKDWAVSDELLRKALENLTFVLLQNNNDDVMLLTETADVIRDIIERLEQDGKDIELLKKDVAALKTALLNLKPHYSSLINGIDLPDSIPCDNVFSFRNHSITFCGRQKEIYKIQEWLKTLGVSVLGVTGPGGSGKSRLALHIAHLEENNRKVVWADKTILTELLTCNDFSYSQPVLFIFDYAAQYEKDLDKLIKLMVSRKNPNVKFLLLERSDIWYISFIKLNDILKSISVESPIELSTSELSEENCIQIMRDFSIAKYDRKDIPQPDQECIIEKTRILSGKQHSARCLFLLLVTDAYLRGDSIQILSTKELLDNYIQHSFIILGEQYGEEIIKRGFRVLAYATACGGIEWEDDHPAIQNDLDEIFKGLTDNRDQINRFFQQLSESSEYDVLSAFKPDLIGEFLFLYEWKKLLRKGKRNWLSTLLKQEYSRSFLSLCLSDWHTLSDDLCNMLSDTTIDTEQRILSAQVLNKAVHVSQLEEAQDAFSDKIMKLNLDKSVAILKEHINSMLFVIANSKSNKGDKYKAILDSIIWQDYLCTTNIEKQDLALALSFAASIYTTIADYDKALEHSKKAKAIFENVLGEEHPYTARAYEQIALEQKALGKYKSSIDNFKRSLAIHEKALGEDHPDTISTYHNIAHVYQDIDDLNSALQYARIAKEKSEKVLGKDCLQTAMTYNCLATIYLDLGNNKLALEYSKQALSIKEKVLGKNHPKTAITCHTVATVYMSLRKYDTALFYCLNALPPLEKKFGKDHPFIATLYENIATIYCERENTDYVKALDYSQKALAIKEKALGKNHPDTLSAYHNIASIYVSMGDLIKASHLFKMVIPLAEKVFGKEHTETAGLFNDFANVFISIREYDKAIEYYTKALSILNKQLGKEHPSTIKVYNNIAKVYCEKGDLENELETLKIVLSIQEKAYGTQHQDTLITYWKLGRIYFDLGNTEKAFEYAQKAGILP